MKRRLEPVMLACVLSLGLTGCSQASSFVAVAGANSVSSIAANATTENNSGQADSVATNLDGYLVLASQGMLFIGGTLTEPVEGEYDPTMSFMDATRAGNTEHVNHANEFYQIPAEDNGNPILYLHGYGQSRMGWMTTPNGRIYS